jgi:hypothetical protein
MGQARGEVKRYQPRRLNPCPNLDGILPLHRVFAPNYESQESWNGVASSGR